MPTRTTIRTQAAAIITTVYIGRRRGIPAAALPAACIYMEEEQKESAAIGSADYFRTLTLITEIHVSANNAQTAEESLDTLTAAREDAMKITAFTDGLIHRIDPQSDRYDLDEEGHRSAAVAICTDQIQYID